MSTGMLAGCLGSMDDASTSQALVSTEATGFPADRDQIEWFCSRLRRERSRSSGISYPVSHRPTSIAR
jgi:hypothetical protein